MIDEAVHCSPVGMAEGIRAATGEARQDFLDKRSSPDDLAAGAALSPAPVLVDMMDNPDYRVFTF